MAEERPKIAGVRIKLASPERLRSLSRGEVTKPETLNYRSLRPERGGLFCECIFGPVKSFECSNGKSKRGASCVGGPACETCDVENTDKRVRRERMGHIELHAKIVHIWYLRGIPSRLSLLLGTPLKDLEKIVYFAPTRRREDVYKVVSENNILAKKGSLISSSQERIHRHYDAKFKAEEAWRVRVDKLPVNTGDIVSDLQVRRYHNDYGEDLFTVERAFSCLVKGSEEEKKILPEHEAEAWFDENGGDACCEKEALRLNGHDSYIVTSVLELPFKDKEILSVTEKNLYEKKYPKRFHAMKETMTIEEPSYIIIENGNSPFERAEVVIESEEELCSAYDDGFKAEMGADGIYDLLCSIDLTKLTDELRQEILDCSGQKKRKLIKRLQVAEDFRKGDSRPEWMVLSVLPVIPPDLRPMVQLDGGRCAKSDLNDLYKGVINRNNRLKKLLDIDAPENIIRNEKRMLQEAVDALIDNGRRGKAVLGAGNRPLKSLTDLLRGKKGRFRQNLLGKRVDYSGRSVIVIGPHLKIYQCGLPKQMALELFKPFVVRELVKRGMTPNVKSASRAIESRKDEVWEVLEEIIKDHPVMLNRAPTLHRLGIQAFEPVLIEGKAIRLHPLVCTAFNADFDGDQMAIHLPLSIEAQTEARVLMLSSNNLLSPASGKPVVTPTQDIILGVYYLTTMTEGLKGQGLFFSDMDDVISALDHGIVHVNTKVYIKKDADWECDTCSEACFFNEEAGVWENHPIVENKWIETTPGRVLFNQALPEKFRYKNVIINKKEMGKLLDAAYDKVGQTGMVQMLDSIKSLGYRWSTVSGISLGVGDIVVPEEKNKIVAETLAIDGELTDQYEMGVMTEDEYMRQKDILWSDAGRNISDKIMDGMEEGNALRIMVDSGARGSRGQVAQMAGIRGLMADPSGRIISYPIATNFREGLNTLEYFISTHGARKGLADTALRTAKSGYLTRRLVDVAQDLIVTEEDCDTHHGVEIRPLLQQDGKATIPMSERLAGRISLENVMNPETGEVLLTRNEEISAAKAKLVEELGITSVWVRSPLTCALRHGICRTCYGLDLATRKRVSIGESVGVVAAQSIGEPGTQLTMRTFHTGGVRQFTGEDITQGLPRIEQLFEVRRPKKVAILAEDEGTIVEIRDNEGKRKIILAKNTGEENEEKATLAIPASQNLKSIVREGNYIHKGDELTEGYIDPQQLLEVKGLEAVQHYLLDGIQEVYRSQGVSINDKHIETILRKVAPVNRVRVMKEGDSDFVAGELVWKDDLEHCIEDTRRENAVSMDIAYNFLKNYKFVSGVMEDGEFKGAEFTEEALADILKPDTTVSEMTVADENGAEVRVLVGRGNFRRNMSGLEVTDDFVSDVLDGTAPVEIAAGTRLTSELLSKITEGLPTPISVCDAKILDEKKGKVWFAAPVTDAEGHEIIKKDSLLNDEAVALLKSNKTAKIKLWKNFETINIEDGMHHVLIEHFFGRSVTQAIDANGEEMANVRVIDGSIVKGIVEGTISGVRTDDVIITKEYVIRRLITERAMGKVLLENVLDADGNILAEAGHDITLEYAAKLAGAASATITVRSKSTPVEQYQLRQRATFLRRLREEPEWKPVVHGVTKAALATDSFLSAASFQQTAQVLAAAAVRGDVDTLVGLKENVIIGLLIPAGTGVERRRSISVCDKPEETEEQQY